MTLAAVQGMRKDVGLNRLLGETHGGDSVPNDFHGALGLMICTMLTPIIGWSLREIMRRETDMGSERRRKYIPVGLGVASLPHTLSPPTSVSGLKSNL